jgi:hypothetical protein
MRLQESNPLHPNTCEQCERPLTELARPGNGTGDDADDVSLLPIDFETSLGA